MSQDPQEKGPQPPQPEQQQTPPGTEAQMQPPPDYGETSYKGSGRLEGRATVITGTDLGIGRAVALAPVYVLLASDDGSYISSSRVAVTGGVPVM